MRGDELKGELRKAFNVAVQKRHLTPKLREVLEAREKHIVKSFGEKRLTETKTFQANYPKLLANEIKKLMTKQSMPARDLKPGFADGTYRDGEQLQGKARENIKNAHTGRLHLLMDQESLALDKLRSEFIRTSPGIGRAKADFAKATRPSAKIIQMPPPSRDRT